MHQRLRHTIVLASAAGLLLVPACSDDTDDASTADTTAASTAASTDGSTSGSVGDDAADTDPLVFCENVLEVDRATTAASEGTGSVEDAQAALDAVESTAPAELSDAVATAVGFGRAQLADPEGGGPPDPEFNTAYGTILDYVQAECDYQGVDASAREYEYQGLPDTLDAGPTVVRLTNEGQEYHEMLFLQVADGVTESAEELLALPEDQADAKIAATAGGAFASVGDTGAGLVDLQPGRYIVLCFLPVGATQEAFDQMMSGGAEPDGAPHATQGMFHEITVS